MGDKNGEGFACAFSCRGQLSVGPRAAVSIFYSRDHDLYFQSLPESTILCRRSSFTTRSIGIAVRIWRL